MIDAGAMRHRVTVLRHKPCTDSYGDPRDLARGSWETVGTVWAAVDPVSGREFYEAQQAQSEVTHKVTTRYHNFLRPGMRLEMPGHSMEIISVIDWQMRHEHLLLMCREVV